MVFLLSFFKMIENVLHSKLVFYAFLLDRLGDAVAIDDVVISSTIDEPAGAYLNQLKNYRNFF